jgi:hypothetical protein
MAVGASQPQHIPASRVGASQPLACQPVVQQR